jgi:HD-like signal output (HDOD) protein/CheY-like chemotaxis protein
MPNRILFVDDEPLVLSGLRRSLHNMGSDWTMVFASSGAEALQILDKDSFDVVVTDMRMPGMTGAQLLEEVSRRSPQTVRLALSGQYDQEMVVRSVGPIHQYLSKPCDREQLRTKIQQAIALRDLLASPALKAVVSQLRSIPSLPDSYQQMLAELRSPNPDVPALSSLIEKDMGMSAKCLQLVNSAFFGLRTNVSNTTEAVKLLGYDTIRALVLSSHIFSQFESEHLNKADVAWLWEHSLAVSGMARALAELQAAHAVFKENAFTAGLLHDVGKLVLASCLGAKYKAALELARNKKIGITAAEIETFGCTHAEVGAYLLGIWGLPHPILEAIAWCRTPSESPSMELSALAFVHSACVYHKEACPSDLADPPILDVAYLERLGLKESSEAWREACQKRLYVTT